MARSRVLKRRAVRDPDAELEWTPIREVPRHFAPAIRKSQAALARYLKDSGRADLDEVQAAWDAIVADSRFDDAPGTFRADLLGRDAAARLWRAATDGSTRELDSALEALGRALSLTPAGGDRALYLHNVGMAHVLRFQLSRGEGELDAALDVLRQAIDAARGDPRLRPLALSGAADVLQTRFRMHGARDDIDQAVALATEAVEQAPTDSRRAWRYRGILSGALAYRYDAFGVIDDLQHAIALRISSSGEVEPRDSGALGTLLRRRWIALHDPHDLDWSIDLLRDFSGTTAAGRPARLTNLANSLLERFDETRDIEDAREAAEANEQSVALTSEGDWQLPSRHNNAGNSMRALYEATRDVGFLEQAVQHYERAVALTGPTAQERPSREYNLGNARQAVYERTGADEDAAAVTAAYRAACETGLASSLEWALASARVWATWAAGRAAWPEAAESATYGIEAVDELFRRQLGRDEKESWLARAAGLPSLAAFCLSAAERPADAAVAFERGRAFLLSEAIEQSRIDLGQLESAGRADLAERYRAVSRAVRSARGRTAAETA